MSRRAVLIVGQSIDEDSGTARLDKETMKYIGVESGGEVDVHAIIYTPAQVKVKVKKALAKDEGAGIIRLALDKMRLGGFTPGMQVIVEKSSIETLKTALSEKAALVYA